MAVPLLDADILDVMRDTLYGDACEVRLIKARPNTPRETIATPARGWFIQNEPHQKDADRNQLSRLLIAAEALTDAQRGEMVNCNVVELEAFELTNSYEVEEAVPFQQINSGWVLMLKQITPTFS
jgi:hypothetical protein